MINTIKKCTLVLALSILPSLVMAQSSDPVLRQLMSDDVEAIAHIDLKKIKSVEIVDSLTKFGFLPRAQQQMAQGVAMQLQNDLDSLIQAGVQSLYVVLRMSDISSKGTTLVAKVAPEADVNQVMSMMKNSAQSMAIFRLKTLNFNHFAKSGQLVIGAATKEQVAAVQKGGPNNRPNRASQFDTQLVFSESIGVAVFLTEDSRRVIREMMPTLPTPLQEVTGKMIANEIQFAGLTAKLSGKLDAKILIQSKNESQKLAKNIRAALTNLDKLGLPPNELVSKLTSKMEVSASDGLVEVSMTKLLADPKALGLTLAPELKKIRAAAQRTQMLNNLRQNALAMHNYESAFRQFPMRANLDANGKPLLSWRVHILPFVGEKELYDQFKLDEPWDSLNNRKLVSKMPRLYRDPTEGGRQNNAAGKTTIQVPIAKLSIFENFTPIKFRDIKDGSSNTILIVQVAHDRAVPWSQPADWEVDENSPTNGLFNKDMDSTSVAIADGSVHTIPKPLDPQKLLNMLTKDGGEITTINDLRKTSVKDR